MRSGGPLASRLPPGVRGWLRAMAAALLLSWLGIPAWAGTTPGAPAASAAAAGLLTFVQADFCQLTMVVDAPPGSACAWQPVELAKRWRPASNQLHSDAWFRLHFTLDALPQQPPALYFVAFNRGGRVFVNGQSLVDFGPMDDPLPLNWNRSEYAVVPLALLHAGANEIEIQQRAYWWEQGSLAPVRLGSQDVLRPMWQARVFWQNDLVRILGVSTGTIGVFMLGVWLGRRRDATYFWFGCASLLWTVTSLDYFVASPPIDPRTWDQFVAVAPVLRGVLMFMFILRYCGMRRPWLETAWWLYFGIGAVAVFAGHVPKDWLDAWYLVVLVASAYFFYMQVRAGLRQSWLEGVAFAVAGVAQIALSAYDLWLFSQNHWIDRVYLAHFSAPLYLFVVGSTLIRRFIDSLNAYEKLAGVLEQRVADKAAELERNYEQLLEARRNEALAMERTRIMSEMHDGIGSQLTMALSLVRSLDREADPGGAGEDGRVAMVLRESIEDLQLIIDSLEPVENDLLTVLGTLRYRLQDRLGKGGIDLHWNVVDLPPLPMLTPHSVLSILRIVQEAFANCLKHSGASRITVTTGLRGTAGVDETAHISIVDNGRGLGNRAGAGRGLVSMRRRAVALGGRLDILSTEGRTEVLVEFPTLRPSAA